MRDVKNGSEYIGKKGNPIYNDILKKHGFFKNQNSSEQRLNFSNEDSRESSSRCKNMKGIKVTVMNFNPL